MALPGRKGPVIPTFKVSIGERKSKTSRPETMDYITIRYYSRDKEVWVVHRELQARLEEIAGELGKYGPTWMWKREHGEVEVTPAEVRLIQAAIDRVVERKQAKR